MGFISEMFSTENAATATFYASVKNVINGTVQPKTWTEVKEISGLLWYGSTGVSPISDKLKTQVEAIFACDYDAEIIALDNTAKLVYNDIDFEILYIENVGEQDEVLQILLKRDKSD